MRCEATMREEHHPSGAQRFVCAREQHAGHAHDWVTDVRPWGSEISDEGDRLPSVSRELAIEAEFAQ